MKKSIFGNFMLQVTTLLLLFLFSACGGSGGGGGNDSGVYDIAGTITPTSGSRIDSDVNDPFYDYKSNDSINTAQVLPNPVTLGGFVSVSGSGVGGSRFESVGDVSDFFSVQLLAGQIIRLNPAKTASNLDLILLDNTGAELLRPALGLGLNEEITVPGNFTGARDFFIEVRAVAGDSNYALSIGLAVQPVSASDLIQDFVVGEVIVKFKDKILPQGVTQDSMSMRADSVGLQAVAGAPGRSMLMRFENTEQLSLAQKKLSIASDRQSLPTDMQQKLDTIRVMQALSKRADVESARLNYIYKTLASPDDPYYPVQWHYPLINLPQAWDVTKGSPDVIVAVIDTGVLLNHPDLENKLVPGFDFIRDASTAADNESDGIIGDIDSNPDDPGDGGGSVRGSSFHGSHVAGTIAAETNNAVGVAGVGWNVKVMPLRALGVGSGTSYDIEQAVLFAAGLENDSGTLPAQKADVINLSLGGPGGAGTTPDAYVRARAAGVIIVAAAGNEGNNVPIYPASYDDAVFSVSAVDINKERAFYSSFGSHVDVAAPGGDSSRNLNGDTFPDGVMSTQGSDISSPITFTYDLKQGTSMATPHIAGVAALMKSVYPSMTPQEFGDALSSGAITEDLGATSRDDQFGHGLIDALKAVLTAQQLAAGGALPDNPFLAVTPGSLNFGSTGVTASLNVRNTGTGVTPLTISSVSNDSGGWLTHATPTGGGDLGDYIFTVDRSALDDNIYSATITIVSSVNTVTIPVIMQKSSAQTFDDAGVLYVFLLNSAGQQATDPLTALPIDPVAVRPVNGQYQYRFDNIAVGDYQILAGTDLDNDLKVCNAGEGCGNYFDSTAERSVFTLNQDLLDADFIVGFNNSLSSASISEVVNPQNDIGAKRLSR